MASKKGLGIGEKIMNKIGDALTPRPKVEPPEKVKSNPSPGGVASPDYSLDAIKKRQRQLDSIK